MNVTYRFCTILIMASFLLSASSLKALADFTTGFEAPTYVSGTVVGQDSWAGGEAPRVQTAAEIEAELTSAGLNAADAVHGGSQALIVTSPEGSSSTTRPISGLESTNNVVMDVWARPLTPGSEGSTVGTNLGNIFMTMEDSGGTRAAAFRFGATVVEDVLESTSIDVFSEGSGWVPTGVEWSADTWYNIRLDADYSAKTYDAYVDGALVQDDVAFYSTASTELSQIRIFRGSGQAGMIVDDLTVIPEPASLALLLTVGGLTLLSRRACVPRS